MVASSASRSDGSARTIWQQDGDDRALAASFGDQAERVLAQPGSRPRTASRARPRRERAPGYDSPPSTGTPTGSTSPPRSRLPTSRRSCSGSTRGRSRPRSSCRSTGARPPSTSATSPASSTALRRPRSPPGHTGRPRRRCRPSASLIALPSLRELIDAQPGSEPPSPGARQGVARWRRRRHRCSHVRGPARPARRRRGVSRLPGAPPA